MPRAKSATCPHCAHATFDDFGSYRECARCGYIGWSWHQKVKKVGRRRGGCCPNCGNYTLHRILELPSGQAVRRCATCDFSGIEPSAAVLH